MLEFVNRFYPARYTAFLLVILLFAVNSLWLLLTGQGGLTWVIWAVLLALGIRDVRQSHHAILRNYPIIGHLRFLLEYIRPEIRQYFIESETESAPFSRAQRSLVYARAKGQSDKRPFGTQMDVLTEGYEWLTHSMNPSTLPHANFRIRIGNAQCTQPYEISLFNVSAMSFGALSANAVLALNQGAKLGGFAHDTGEGSISRHHRVHGGDLIWEIGSGYFGCRHPDGTFSEEKFTANALDPQVKMIELKLSQGAKPGHGGVLLGPKVTPEIAEARGVAVGEDCVSPSSHSRFQDPEGLLRFVQCLRELSGGKPTGFKLCVGHAWEWFAIAKAMVSTQIVPDFIVVDGSEGGTGAAPLEFSDHMGMPMIEGLRLVHNTLVGLNLRDQIKLGASGKIVSAFDIARTLAMGADWCNSARGFMFALGCIQAQTCHTGQCPTGVTTQDPVRQKALVVPDKAQRVKNFHHHTLDALKELLEATGVQGPNEVSLRHITRRVGATDCRPLSDLYPSISAGSLVDARPIDLAAGGPAFERHWHLADPKSWSAKH
ncbi:MAG: FMN-binding glutamate synthase family protein [Alphaproteobacteria bacterium]|nr:FMN-binding glutamate synthase family protein [Alphaproteobacteria bacterium]